MNTKKKIKATTVVVPPIQISLSKLRSKDVLEWLRFAYYGDTPSFVKAFSSAGITIDTTNPESELQTLANLHNSGADMDGSLQDADGNVLKFDIPSFVQGIQLRHSAINSSNIQLVA